MIRNFTLHITFLLLLGVTHLHAQVTTSSLSGTILLEDQEKALGAMVKAVHIPSGSEYHTMTDESGSYFLEGMKSGGPYQVVFDVEGYDTRVIDNVTLPLGETYILNVDLAGAEKSTDIGNVTIVGHLDPMLNSNRTGASTNISNKVINRMPTINRSLTDFTRLTPQAGVNNGFAGRDGRFNNLQIDGANFNNAFGLSSDPLPGGSNQPISLDAIEEISINLAPYDVRQTGFTGAGINAVTRSGTNELSGSAYIFYRPRSFTGLNVGDEKLDENTRTQNMIVGARLGAPIIKNKLFIFGSFEYEKSSASGNNWVTDNGQNSGDPNTTRVSQADAEAVSNYLRSQYGYDPGAYQGYANNYLNSNIKALLRLDWNISNNHKFNIRFNTMSGTSDQGTNASSGPNPRSGTARISSESIAFENANYQFKNTVSSLTAELNSIFSSKLSNQFLATYSRIQDTRNTPGTLFPFVDIWKDGTNYMSFGTELFSYNNDVINNNITITDNLTYKLGKHTLTGGLSFQSMSFGNSYMRMGTSYYRYNDISTFLAGGAPDVYGVTYPYEENDGYARVKFGLIGAYVQDKFTINPQFNITGGIRVDVPLFFNEPMQNPIIDTISLLDKDGNPTKYTTASWPKSTPLFSPRIGFNYDVFGDRSLQLRGGTGIFSGNIPFVWFTNMPTNSGMIQNTFEPVDSATLSMITHLEKDPMYWVNALPEKFPKTGGKKAPGSFALIAPDFKMPQVWRTSLGMDYSIPNSPLVATIDLIYTKDIVGVYQFNANRKAASGRMNFENDNRDLWANSNDARYNPVTNNIISVLSNNNEGYSFAATAGLTLKETNGFFGSLFYTYSNSKDITGNPGSAANSAWSNNYSVNDPNELLLGYSQYAIPHRIVGNVSYRFAYARNFATTISLFYNGAHQGRFAYTYTNDVNRDGVSLDLLYIPNNVTAAMFDDIEDDGTVLFTAAEQAAAFNKFINDNGLSSYRGKYVDRNNGLMPWLNRFDARILQDFIIPVKGKPHTIQLSLDILNVGNLLNKNWGLMKQLNGGSDYNYGLLKMNSMSADGTPTFQMVTIREGGKTILPTTPFRDLFRTTSTWGMQVGIRYSF